MNDIVKKVLPHVVIILGILALLYLYCSPLLDGQMLSQSDIVSHKGMSKEIVDYRTTHGKEPLWTDAMFGGMPAYQISVLYPSNLLANLDKIITLGLPNPLRQLFVLFVGFYFLMNVCRVNPILSGIAALAFTFSSYWFIALESGHNGKVMAVAYAPPLIAGVLAAYQGRKWLGIAITAVAMTLAINANHPQITYYFMMVVVAIGIWAFMEAIKKQKLGDFIQTSVLLVIAILIGIVPNISRLWTTYEYTDYTMRGKSELQKDLSQRKSGLDKGYAFDWSYGVTETFTFIIPDYYGRGSNTDLGTNCELYKQAEANPQLRQQLEQGFGRTLDDVVRVLPTYWGEQPFTPGGTYLGIAIVFLYILSFFVLKNNLKWYVLGVTALTISLAWGRHFFLSDFFFDYFPLYNKFRAVAMMLVVAEFTFPFMGFLALSEVLQNMAANKKGYKEELWGQVWKSAAILAGIFVFAYILAQMSSFKSSQEMAQGGGLGDLLVADRKAMLWKDVVRGMMFLGLTLGIFWAYLNEKINQTVFLVVLTVSFLFDLWTVDKRFLNDDNFVSSGDYDSRVTQMTPADEYILKDKSHKRMFKFGDSFNDAQTSYFHKSVGGYHPAKFRRYQDLIYTDSLYEGNVYKPFKYGIKAEMQTLGNSLQKGVNDSLLKAAFVPLNIFNMMNTKYFIYDPNKPPLTNSSALGNAWFVSDIKQAKNADEELWAVKSFNPAQTAIVADEFIKEVQGFTPSKDSSAKINLLEYQPNYLKYEANNAKEGLAVFSEIYYGKGWNAYVDGKVTPHIRANYVLRAMKLPAGKHTVEFKFEPESYYKGETYSLIGSIATILLCGVGLFLHFRGRKEEEKA